MGAAFWRVEWDGYVQGRAWPQQHLVIIASPASPAPETSRQDCNALQRPTIDRWIEYLAIVIVLHKWYQPATGNDTHHPRSSLLTIQAPRTGLLKRFQPYGFNFSSSWAASGPHKAAWVAQALVFQRILRNLGTMKASFVQE